MLLRCTFTAEDACTPFMFLRQLDLSTALRPSLYDDEVLLHVSQSCRLQVSTSTLSLTQRISYIALPFEPV